MADLVPSQSPLSQRCSAIARNTPPRTDFAYSDQNRVTVASPAAFTAAAAVSDLRTTPQALPGCSIRAWQSSGARWTSLALIIASCISYDVIIAGDGVKIPRRAKHVSFSLASKSLGLWEEWGAVGNKPRIRQHLKGFSLTLFNESQASARRWITAVCWSCDPPNEVFSTHPFLTDSFPNKKQAWTLLPGSSCL